MKRICFPEKGDWVISKTAGEVCEVTCVEDGQVTFVNKMRDPRFCPLDNIAWSDMLGCFYFKKEKATRGPRPS